VDQHEDRRRGPGPDGHARRGNCTLASPACTEDIALRILPSGADTTPPTILSVKAQAVNTQAVVRFSEPAATASATVLANYAIDRGVTCSAAATHLVAMTPAPGSTVSGVMSLTLVFDSPVQIGAGAVEVSDGATGENRDFSLAGDAATNTLTLTWTKALAADVYTVRVIADFVTAVGGAPLDGEVGDPAAPDLPFGKGTPDGDAVLEFTAR